MTGRFYFLLDPKDSQHSVRQFMPAIRFVALLVNVFGDEFAPGEGGSPLSRIWPDLETSHTYRDGDEILLVTPRTEAGELWLQFNQPPDVILDPERTDL